MITHIVITAGLMKKSKEEKYSKVVKYNIQLQHKRFLVQFEKYLNIGTRFRNKNKE